MKVFCTSKELLDKLVLANVPQIEFKLMPEVPPLENSNLVDYIVSLCAYNTDCECIRICFEYIAQGQPGVRDSGMMKFNYKEGDHLVIKVCTLMFNTDSTSLYVRDVHAKYEDSQIKYRHMDNDFNFIFSTDFKYGIKAYNQHYSAGDEALYDIPNQLIPTLA